jgi:endoglucanase
LHRDGLELLHQARYGRWRLPPDWLEVNRADGSLGLAGAFPGRFSYDAIRVPLFLQWSGLAPEVVESVASFWSGACARQPCWADLKTDIAMGRFGLRGAMSIAGFIMEGKCQSGVVQADAAAPGDSYYSAALHLLTRMAISEQSS